MLGTFAGFAGAHIHAGQDAIVGVAEAVSLRARGILVPLAMAGCARETGLEAASGWLRQARTEPPDERGGGGPP